MKQIAKNLYEDARFKPLIQIALDANFITVLDCNLNYTDSFTDFKLQKITLGLKGVSLDLVKYLLAHEIAHILNPKRFANLYFKSRTLEVYAWKTAFDLLPITHEALDLAQKCLNTYIHGRS